VSLGLIVFARLDSRRLPGKALLEIAGRPLLGRVLDRLRLVAPSRPIVVATSERALDDPIARFAYDEGVAAFRGSTHDVLGRALSCAEAHDFDAIVRLSGDSPFLDPGLIGRCIERFIGAAGGLDLVTNVMPRSLPPGLSVEVIARPALRTAAAEATSAEEREHLTPFFYRQSAHFRIANIAAPDAGAAGVRLTVDDQGDLDQARWIAERLGARAASAPLEEVVALARAFAASHPGGQAPGVPAAAR
jgi:spore coat polysaccharide biosynthesis protein SpsF